MVTQPGTGWMDWERMPWKGEKYHSAAHQPSMTPQGSLWYLKPSLRGRNPPYERVLCIALHSAEPGFGVFLFRAAPPCQPHNHFIWAGEGKPAHYPRFPQRALVNTRLLYNISKQNMFSYLTGHAAEWLGSPMAAPALTCTGVHPASIRPVIRGATKPLQFAGEVPSSLHVPGAPCTGPPDTGGERVLSLPNPLPLSPGSLPAHAGGLQLSLKLESGWTIGKEMHF